MHIQSRGLGHVSLESQFGLCHVISLETKCSSVRFLDGARQEEWYKRRKSESAT